MWAARMHRTSGRSRTPGCVQESEGEEQKEGHAPEGLNDGAHGNHVQPQKFKGYAQGQGHIPQIRGKGCHKAQGKRALDKPNDVGKARYAYEHKKKQ